jgi:urease accessory protein
MIAGEYNTGLRGKLELGFIKRGNKTVLRRCFQRPPLKASNLLYSNNQGQATIYIMDVSGGMLAGDKNELLIDLAAGTGVNVLQQSATKIYPSENGKWSQQELRIKIGPGAILNWLPESIIPYKDSLYRGNIDVEMHPDSSLFWGEIIAPGRFRRNEVFEYRELINKFTVRQNKRLLVYDNYQFRPAVMDMASMLVYDNFFYSGSCYYISEKVKSIKLSEKGTMLFTDTGVIRGGITKLADNVLLGRWLANDVLLLKKQIKTLQESICLIMQET